MNTPAKCPTSTAELPPSGNPCFGCNGCSSPASGSGATISVIGGISAAHDYGLEYDHADLLIFTKVSDSDLGGGPRHFDDKHGGIVSRTINESGFRGEVQEVLEVELPSVGPSARTRRIAVIGLGRAQGVTRKSMCGLFNQALALAHRHNAHSLLIPVFPWRTSAAALNLKATGAILRCLVEERKRRGTLGNLQEITLLSTPQARRHIEAGLAVEHTLCSVCRIPNLF